MSQDVLSTFYALSKELRSSREVMSLYFQLFCNDHETTTLLNRAAGPAFVRIQPCIARDLLLSIARLCDPAASGNRDNCTFDKLIILIKSDGRVELANRLRKRFESVISKRCAPLKHARNKRLAHNDHITMTQMMGGQDIVPGISIRHLNKVIRSMRKLLAEVAASYQCYDDNIPYDFTGPRFGNEVAIPGRDFRHLITCLREGTLPELSSIEDLI